MDLCIPKLGWLINQLMGNLVEIHSSQTQVQAENKFNSETIFLTLFTFSNFNASPKSLAFLGLFNFFFKSLLLLYLKCENSGG